NVKKDIGHNLDFECDENGNYERVACSCGARGPVVAYTKQSIIDGWNNRPEPKHETVEQWEKRTGQIYPDDGPVWSFYRYIGLSNNDEWKIEKWGSCKHWEWDGDKKAIVANEHGKPEGNR
ncbi:MAG: hypothetical protein GY804_00855, partial [Alphaproteobacteria bacterium]|nr:hypothetical protein [Alphaproteobacteria bacterium]